MWKAISAQKIKNYLLLTKISQTPKVSDATVCLIGYSIVQKDRLSRGGDAAVRFKNSIKIVEINSRFCIVKNTNFEYLCMYLIFNSLKIRFSVFTEIL